MDPKDISFEQFLASGVPALFDALEIIMKIFVPTAIIATIIIIFLSNTSLFRKWVARNKKKKKISIFDIANILGFKKDKTGGISIIKGSYGGKEIRVSRQITAVGCCATILRQILASKNFFGFCQGGSIRINASGTSMLRWPFSLDTLGVVFLVLGILLFL